MVVHHVFPYDPSHLGLTVGQWWRGQLLRWPLAAVARSAAARETVVHVIAHRAADLDERPSTPLRLEVHRTIYPNARRHGWGDDWSTSLGRALRRARHEDVVVVHLEGYAAGRLSLRYAHRARCVLVLHGRGASSLAVHSAADVSVVLNDDARDELRASGWPDERLTSLVPSIDRSLFRPADQRPAGPPVLGYVGRLEESKGAFELPDVVRSLSDLGVRLECVGSPPRVAEARRGDQLFAGLPVELRGEMPPAEVANRMRSWSALLVPSYSEGMPLAALEALCTGIPVVGVEGVLPRTLASRRGVLVGPRAELGDRVRTAVTSRPQPDADWIPDHRVGGERWDEIYRALPAWQPRARPSFRPRLGRYTRVRISP